MQYIKEQVLEKIEVKVLVQFLVLSAIAIFLPFFIHLQPLTGPIINAIFILALFLVGIRAALVLALIPSLMALSGGLLPPVLAPAVPFIMISNVIFILAIDRFCNYKGNQIGYLLGVVVGGLFKFLFLYASINIISQLLIKKELAVKVAQMMSWPQFATAVIGGMIAWIVLRLFKKI